MGFGLANPRFILTGNLAVCTAHIMYKIVDNSHHSILPMSLIVVGFNNTSPNLITFLCVLLASSSIYNLHFKLVISMLLILVYKPLPPHPLEILEDPLPKGDPSFIEAKHEQTAPLGVTISLKVNNQTEILIFSQFIVIFVSEIFLG